MDNILDQDYNGALVAGLAAAVDRALEPDRMIRTCPRAIQPCYIYDRAYDREHMEVGLVGVIMPAQVIEHVFPTPVGMARAVALATGIPASGDRALLFTAAVGSEADQRLRPAEREWVPIAGLRAYRPADLDLAEFARPTIRAAVRAPSVDLDVGRRYHLWVPPMPADAIAMLLHLNAQAWHWPSRLAAHARRWLMSRVLTMLMGYVDPEGVMEVRLHADLTPDQHVGWVAAVQTITGEAPTAAVMGAAPAAAALPVAPNASDAYLALLGAFPSRVADSDIQEYMLNVVSVAVTAAQTNHRVGQEQLQILVEKVAILRGLRTRMPKAVGRARRIQLHGALPAGDAERARLRDEIQENYLMTYEMLHGICAKTAVTLHIPPMPEQCIDLVVGFGYPRQGEADRFAAIRLHENMICLRREAPAGREIVRVRRTNAQKTAGAAAPGAGAAAAPAEPPAEGDIPPGDRHEADDVEIRVPHVMAGERGAEVAVRISEVCAATGILPLAPGVDALAAARQNVREARLSGIRAHVGYRYYVRRSPNRAAGHERPQKQNEDRMRSFQAAMFMFMREYAPTSSLALSTAMDKFGPPEAYPVRDWIVMSQAVALAVENPNAEELARALQAGAGAGGFSSAVQMAGLEIVQILDRGQRHAAMAAYTRLVRIRSQQLMGFVVTQGELDDVRAGLHAIVGSLTAVARNSINTEGNALAASMGLRWADL